MLILYERASTNLNITMLPVGKAILVVKQIDRVIHWDQNWPERLGLDGYFIDRLDCNGHSGWGHSSKVYSRCSRRVQSLREGKWRFCCVSYN